MRMVAYVSGWGWRCVEWRGEREREKTGKREQRERERENHTQREIDTHQI